VESHVSGFGKENERKKLRI